MPRSQVDVFRLHATMPSRKAIDRFGPTLVTSAEPSEGLGCHPQLLPSFLDPGSFLGRRVGGKPPNVTPPVFPRKTKMEPEMEFLVPAASPNSILRGRHAPSPRRGSFAIELKLRAAPLACADGLGFATRRFWVLHPDVNGPST